MKDERSRRMKRKVNRKNVGIIAWWEWYGLERGKDVGGWGRIEKRNVRMDFVKKNKDWDGIEEFIKRIVYFVSPYRLWIQSVSRMTLQMTMTILITMRSGSRSTLQWMTMTILITIGITIEVTMTMIIDMYSNHHNWFYNEYDDCS